MIYFVPIYIFFFLELELLPPDKTTKSNLFNFKFLKYISIVGLLNIFQEIL